jgi:hypothetical protein
MGIRLVQEPGLFSNKSRKMLRILPFSSGYCSETEVSGKQRRRYPWRRKKSFVKGT